MIFDRIWKPISILGVKIVSRFKINTYSGSLCAWKGFSRLKWVFDYVVIFEKVKSADLNNTKANIIEGKKHGVL